jgi:hypothetical protein
MMEQTLIRRRVTTQGRRERRDLQETGCHPDPGAQIKVIKFASARPSVAERRTLCKLWQRSGTKP